MNPLTRAKTVTMLRAAIAVALRALAVVTRVRSDEVLGYTVLAMEYFGSIDHPIPTVIISNSYARNEVRACTGTDIKTRAGTARCADQVYCKINSVTYNQNRRPL